MNETLITLHGNIGAHVHRRESAHGAFAAFGVACTPRHLDRASGAWVDGEVQWYSVSAFRTLGRHCLESLSPGDPVVVHGSLSTRSYEHDGVARTDLEVRARSVGHDLGLGTTAFTRMAPAQRTLDEIAA